MSPGTCSTAPSRASVVSRRAAVDFGRPARSATSVTPSGPPASAPSTSNARLMDWTLDNRPPGGYIPGLGGSTIRHGSTSWNPPGASTSTDDAGRVRGHRPRGVVRRRARRADAQRPLRRHDATRSSRGRTSCSAAASRPPGSSTTRWSPGMKIVGIDFRDGILFVPEVLLAANAMKAGMADPAPAPRRDRRRAGRQGRHRDGQGRHPRHRQEPRRDDARGRRLRGLRPRHQHRRRQVPGRARASTSPTSSGCPRC